MSCTRACPHRIHLSALAAGIALTLPALAATASAAAAAGAAAAPLQTLSPITVYGDNLEDQYRVQSSSTATHTDTPLIDIPLSIQAIPASLLHDQGTLSLEGAIRNAPGVSVQQGEGNRDEFVIRGIKTKADFFVDGMRDDSEYFRDLYNVQEVDVLQGPSALLFGRGNAGGVINLVTKQPERKRLRNFDFTTGSWDLARGTLDIGDSIGNNAAFRVNAMAEHSGGFRDHADLHRHGINPTFAFWIGAHTQLDFGLESFHEWQRADRGIPSRGDRPVVVPRSTFFGAPTQNMARARVDSLNLDIKHEFSDHLKFRNTLRISQNRKFYRNVYPGSAVTPDDTLSLSGYEHQNTRRSYLDQAELVADFDTGSAHHELLAGADFAYQHDTDWENTAPTIIHDVPLSDPIVYDVAFDQPARNNRAMGHEIGAYAQDQITFGNHWRAIAGVRWDRFALDARYLLLPAADATRHVDTSWSPRFGVIYKPVENDSLYASVTRSFTPQGANLALSAKSPAGQNLGPEKAVNYEIGNKLDVLDHKLSFTAALFQLDLDNVTSESPYDPSVLVQTGAQRTRGAELTLTGRIAPGWHIAANYARLQAEITSTTKDAAAGAQVGLVPRNQASLWTTWAINDHWGVGGGVVGRSRVYTSFSNKVVMPGYVRTDAMAWYQNRNYRIQLNLDNLFDVHYYASASGDNQIMPGAPRSVELGVRVRL